LIVVGFYSNKEKRKLNRILKEIGRENDPNVIAIDLRNGKLPASRSRNLMVNTNIS
jgi:hypothetical protein